jgi:hypothetical protein
MTARDATVPVRVSVVVLMPAETCTDSKEFRRGDDNP